MPAVWSNRREVIIFGIVAAKNIWVLSWPVCSTRRRSATARLLLPCSPVAEAYNVSPLKMAYDSRVFNWHLSHICVSRDLCDRWSVHALASLTRHRILNTSPQPPPFIYLGVFIAVVYAETRGYCTIAMVHLLLLSRRMALSRVWVCVPQGSQKIQGKSNVFPAASKKEYSIRLCNAAAKQNGDFTL